MARARRVGMPIGAPPPPCGQYGKGKTDLLAEYGGRIWACLIENGALSTQEFYYWDPREGCWIDKSVPPEQEGDASRVRVPYRALMRLYDRKE